MTRQPTASDLARRLRTSATGQRPEAPPPPQDPAPTTPPAGKPKTIRYTIDLTPEEHRALHLFAYDNGLDIKRVLRAFVRLLDREAALTERVLDEVHRHG